MEGSKGGVSDGATQWLTYWVVFSFITVLESVVPSLCYWIPMYYYNKAALIVWLYHPQSSGAEIIYNQVVRKYILPHLETTKASKEE
jgi:receptor expression-enhancing protein 5/6